jgi:hypothetical protein
MMSILGVSYSRSARSIPEEWVQKRAMGTMLNLNMCCKSTDHCGLNRMGKYIRKNGFSASVM